MQDRQGKPIKSPEFTEKKRDYSYCKIASDLLNRGFVKTTWEGYDDCIFSTQVWNEDKEFLIDETCSPTEELAKKAHEEMTKKWKGKKLSPFFIWKVREKFTFNFVPSE